MSTSRNDEIATTSVSADVVETEPIVLRKTDTVRLVFKATIVDREAPIRGCFVYQRKRSTDDWEDLRGERLTSLRSGEGWLLELRSGEVAALLDGIAARRALYERYGIVWGDKVFVDKASLPQLVQGIVDSPGSEVAEVLASIDLDQLIALGRRVDLSQLDKLLAEWFENASRGDEGYWQGLLADNAWVFSQLTGAPVVLLQEKAYVGGKSIANRGGGELDFLVANELTDNVAFIEIKTPATPLLAGAYRTSGAHSLHKELTGGVVQVLGYRDEFEKSFNALRADSPDLTFRSHNARCFLIAGRADGLSPDEKRSLELFRNGLSDVQIWTFDEVASRLRAIRDVLAEPLGDDAA